MIKMLCYFKLAYLIPSFNLVDHIFSGETVYVTRDENTKIQSIFNENKDFLCYIDDGAIDKHFTTLKTQNEIDTEDGEALDDEYFSTYGNKNERN